MNHVILEALFNHEVDPSEITKEDMLVILEEADEEDCIEFVNTIATVCSLSDEVNQLIIDKAGL